MFGTLSELHFFLVIIENYVYFRPILVYTDLMNMSRGYKYLVLHSALIMVMFFLPGFSGSAQSVHGKGTISGVIRDNEGEPLVGAFVFYKGTKDGVTSDLDGRYSISAPSWESVLVFQYLGMEAVEKTVSGECTLDVTLNPDNEL